MMPSLAPKFLGLSHPLASASQVAETTGRTTILTFILYFKAAFSSIRVHKMFYN
jgi:hypothetical protein